MREQEDQGYGMERMLVRGHARPSPPDIDPFPHANVLDAFFYPMWFSLNLDLVVVVLQFLTEAVLLPHLLEVGLGVDHDEAFPRELFSAMFRYLRPLHGGGRGGLVYRVGVVLDKVGDGVNE
jgi:hypothetical protein